MDLPHHVRHSLEDFRLGAPVHASDGRHVGSLYRIVVDRDSWDPHELIVKKTLMFSDQPVGIVAGLPFEEVIVPFKSVASVARERVDLSITAEAMRRLPPYLSYHYAPVTANELNIEVLHAAFGSLRFAPAIEEADKAPGDIEIRRNENVMLGHQGQRLGHVREVLYDDGELAAIVVHPEGIFEHDLVIPVRFLGRSDDAALFVHMRREDLARLTQFRPEESDS